MDIRAKLVHLNPGQHLSLNDLWDKGSKYMDMAYNAVTARPLNNVFWLDQPTMAFFFVGGRHSLAQFFSAQENLRVFLPAPGDSLAILTDRKKVRFGKDKTAIAVCNAGLRSGYEVRPVADFAGLQGVQPLDVDGARLSTAKLASIVRHLFLNPEKESREVKGILTTTGLWG